MEGEKILKELKTSNSLCKVTRDVKKFLSPVLKKTPLQPSGKSEKPKDLSKFGKYEIFSLKLLKQCIEQCKGEVDDDSASLVQIGAISVESLEFCNRCSGKVPPLSFEKLLFHFASQCFNCAQYDVGLRASDVLCSQLQSEGVRNVHSLEKEGCDILKHTFDLLWKAAVKIEQADGSTLDSTTIDLCLEIRRRSFVCLLSTNFELVFALDRILKSDSRYQKLSNGIGVSPFDHLYEFHVSILKKKDLLGCFDAGSSCTWFVPTVEYMLHLAKICVHSGHSADGREYVQRAQTLCHQHCKACLDKLHPLTSLHVQIVELFITFCDLDMGMMSESHHETNFPEEVIHLLRTISAGLKMSVKGASVEASSLTKVMYSLEALVSCLEEKREQFVKRVPQRECSFIPDLAFPPLRGVFMGYVECVEIHLKLQRLADSSKVALLEKNARSRQLSMLSFLARILLDLLMAEDDEDSGDEIEILRSSSAPHTLVPPPPPDPKRHLADCCLPLLQRSRQVIEKASDGILPCTERKWLGNNAYNLGLALFRSDLFSEASQVLELACDELVRWCGEGRGEKERARRSEEAQLLNKFTLLFDSHRKASCYTTAMETVEKAITSLPTNQISSDNCKRVLVGQWVKAKRDLATEHVDVDTESCHSHRTVAELLKEREGATDDILVSYLEEELRKYKGQSHDTLLDQLAVAHSLLRLYSRADEEEEGGSGTIVDRARITIEVAALRRSCKDLSDLTVEGEKEESSSLALLDKAVSFLEPLTCDTSLLPPHHLCQAHEQLAIAHLWKAICISEQLTESCEPTDPTALPDANEGDIPANKPGVEVCLSKEEEQRMMIEDTVSCLYAAVECWVEMWEVGRGESDYERCFYDLPSAFHLLHLTSTLCLTHSQPLLALKSLAVVLAIYRCNPLPQLKAVYQSALAQYCELALSFGGGEGMEGSLQMCGDSLQPQLSGKAQTELQASFVECQLALAQVKLQNEQFEECRQVLLSVIQHPLLHRRSTLSHSLTARAKLLTARYLQHRKFELKPSQEFLHYLQSEPCEGFEGRPFTLTPLELATDALKVYQNLADHHNIMSKPDAHVSRDASVQGGQDILWGLLCALKEVTRVYLDQGGMREAYYYAREGAMLSRTVLLQGWYVEFLLLMAEVQLTRGQHDSAQTLLQQAGRLTELEDYLSYTTPSHTTPSQITPSHPSSPTVHDDSVELELEEFGRLSISTPPRCKQQEPLHHPTTCMCTLCTNPVTLLQLTTLLRLWGDLWREEVGGVMGCPEEAVTLLTDAVELVEECSVKCDMVLQSISSRPKTLRFTGSSAYFFILLQLSVSQAQTQLQLDNASKALKICEQATKRLSAARIPTSSREFANLYAWLHLTMGVTLVQDVDESKVKRRGRGAKGKKRKHGEAGREPIEKSLSHFLMSYQLCYPTASSLLLRDTCQWLCVSLSSTHANLAHHFLSLSSQVTLSHQAVYTVGKKWRKHHMTPQSPLDDMLHVLTPPLPPPSPPPLLVFRTILQPPPSPPPLSHTQHLLASLPDSWTVCNLCLAPTTPAKKQHHLILAQAGGAGKRCVVVKTPLPDISPLDEFQAILDSSEQSMTIREKRAWWAARRKLDKRMEELVYQLQTQWLQEWESLLSASSSESSSSSFLVLVLGPKVQGLPWEGLLTAQSVSRMPSLPFMAAHKCMLGHRGSVEVDPRHTFYVLNPRGDLPNTEKMFAKWFASQRGWRGVVGRAPTTQEYTTALEEHELFVYCGHGTGRDYLHLDGFQLLSCRASTLLMGCSSGRLAVGGRGDPMGMALNYLISGCPALVANLWDVTDADIDRFCQSLLKSWVQDPTQLSLLDCITKSRAACKLRWLIGASPVVYGVPVLLFA